MAQQMPLPLTISCSSKSRLVLPSWFVPFWYLLTRVVPNKFQKSSKTIVCACVCVDFVQDNPGELVPEGTFHHLLDFLVQNEDNTGRHTNNPRVAWWRNGRASDFRPQGREFDSRSGRSCVTTLGKLLTPTCLEGSPVSSLKCDRGGG